MNNFYSPQNGRST